MGLHTVKVSICIPVYNGERFLGQALESAQMQSFDDFEILVLDNASTDRSASIVKEAQSADRRIRLVRNEDNIGLVDNFNACLKFAQGEYVKYLCADDLLSTDCLTRMTHILDDDPSIALVAGGRQIISEAGEPVTLLNYARESTRIPGHEVINRCLFGGNYVGEPSAVMFRRKIAERGFRNELSHLMDMEMWFYLLEQGSLVCLPEPVCSVRRHSGQMTLASIKSGAMVEDNVRLFDEYGDRPYIKHSWLNDSNRRLRMAYRIWLSRKYLEKGRRVQILKSQSSPIVYHAFMPVLAGTLNCLRRANLLMR